MRFEDSKYFKLITHKKVEFPFGNFYIADHFLISELYEGVHFDWSKIIQVIDYLYDYYGYHKKIGYVTNRVNSYSIEPQLWIRFYEEYNFIIATATVSYNNYNYANASIEKLFTKTSLKRCSNLDEAIEWIQNLKEFK
ncbi:MAG: hypothetical protein R2812_06765 [Gelidibacter sp.]|nr:hypothetical protein [Gelidibacter sp.]MCB0744726.1 hypothetical protein [Ignavibacteriota bacterium]